MLQTGCLKVNGVACVEVVIAVLLQVAALHAGFVRQMVLQEC